MGTLGRVHAEVVAGGGYAERAPGAMPAAAPAGSVSSGRVRAPALPSHGMNARMKAAESGSFLIRGDPEVGA